MIVLPALYWLYGERAVAAEAEKEREGASLLRPDVAPAV
jgi:hypothetical protein